MMDIAVILCCWIVSFVFAGIEAGLLSIDPVRLRHHVKQNRPAAVRLNRLLNRPERLLVTVLLVTNLADILALLLLTRRLVWILGSADFLRRCSLRFRFIFLCWPFFRNHFFAGFRFER